MSSAKFVPGKISYRISEAVKATGLSKATLYREIKAGELEMGKLHGCTVIPADKLVEWFNRQYRPSNRAA